MKRADQVVDTILTVELREDGRTIITHGGREFILATPIQLDYEGRPEWDHWLNHFKFSGVRVED